MGAALFWITPEMLVKAWEMRITEIELSNPKDMTPDEYEELRDLQVLVKVLSNLINSWT